MGILSISFLYMKPRKRKNLQLNKCNKNAIRTFASGCMIFIGKNIVAFEGLPEYFHAAINLLQLKNGKFRLINGLPNPPFALINIVVLICELTNPSGLAEVLFLQQQLLNIAEHNRLSVRRNRCYQQM